MFGARNEQHDLSIRHRRIYFRPILSNRFIAGREINLHRRQIFKTRGFQPACKHNAIVTEAYFHDFVNAIRRASVNIALLDPA